MKNTTRDYSEIVAGNGLVLRAVAASEASTLFGLVDGNREYLGQFLPWIDSTKSVRDSASFIRSIKRRRENGAEYGFGVYQNEVLTGHISLMHLTDNASPEIGYWIAEEFAGRGIATRAAQAVTEFGMDVLGVDYIVIRARIDNVASSAIPRKLGYRLHETEREGTNIVNVWRKDR